MSDQDLKLGQLFLAGFDGMSVEQDHPVVKSIVQDSLGGVILFDRNVDGSRQNITSPAQLQMLTNDLQRYAGNSLIIAVDQEGGKVCRLKEIDGFPATRSADMLASEDNGQVGIQANLMSSTLHECGINFNLAPVVDLNLNHENPIIARYERSYGSNSDKVVELASQFITAHHRNDVACCIKHFPGHGSATADSHLGFVDITDCWQEKELEPYVRLFANGFADAVMTAHVIHRGLDNSALPATLSQPMINKLLREKLGFEGVIVTDDLQMKAISDRWGFEESVQMAILAGVDLVIIGNNLIREKNVVWRGAEAVAKLIDSGRISEDDVRASLNRVSILKKKIAGELSWKNNQHII